MKTRSGQRDGRAGPKRARSRRGGKSGRRGPAAAGRRAQARIETAGRVLRAALPALRRRRTEGLGAVVGVAEGQGGQWDLACAISDETGVGPSGQTTGGGRGGGGVTRLASAGRIGALAGVLSAMGSVHRVRILAKLLEGPGTYRTLQKATKLKAGPLYHHVAQLRLAGLIGPKQRDLYRLTRGGRNLVLVALTLPKLIRDRRPRPQPHGGEGQATPGQRKRG